MHRLMIETGRQKISANESFCPFCKTVVEDEIHFMIKCKTYDLIRKRLFDVSLDFKQNFDHYAGQEKYIFVLTSEYLQIILAKYVFLAEELMSFLMRNH